VGAEPGLYFVGLLFLYALSSPLVGGVGRDAEHIAARHPDGRPAAAALTAARRPGQLD